MFINQWHEQYETNVFFFFFFSHPVLAFWWTRIAPLTLFGTQKQPVPSQPLRPPTRSTFILAQIHWLRRYGEDLFSYVSCYLSTDLLSERSQHWLWVQPATTGFWKRIPRQCPWERLCRKKHFKIFQMLLSRVWIDTDVNFSMILASGT